MSKKILIIGSAVILTSIAALMAYQFIAKGAPNKGIPGIVMDEKSVLMEKNEKTFL